MTEKPVPSQARFIEKLKEWPTLPGVYLMKDESGRILYVGKAKNLRSRVRSYFQKLDEKSGKTLVLTKKIVDIEYTVTHNELEALLLECNLIKKHRPRYNIRLKDDKNYPYVVLDFTHRFPQFRITRKVVLSPNLKYFGPYSAGVREISRFLLKTFQIRDCSDAKFKNRTRPCLNYEIGTCTAPCVNYVTEEDYAKQVREATLFLKGKKQLLLQHLRKEMSEASHKMEFETARVARDKMRAIEKMTEKQNAVLPENLKDIDVVGRYSSGNELQWVVLFIRSGFLLGRRAEKMSLGFGTIEEATRTFLEQFYSVSLIPDEVWVSEDFSDRTTLQDYLSEKAGKEVSVLVRRSEKPMRLLGMAYENAKLLFLEGSKPSQVSASEELSRVLSLPETPHSIEGIDVSNLQGTSPSASLVHFADEKPLKSKYRLYHPKTVEGQNDFAMIFETVKRRYGNRENPPPHLLLIDGGKGQLQAAIRALEELKLQIPVCSLAKSRTERAFTLKTVEKSEERVFLPYRKNPLILREGNPALRLLQQVRDEAHRFAIKSHRIRRKKSAANSPLTEIQGIGEKTREKLLKHFGNLENVQKASVEELMHAGLSKKQALLVQEYCSQNCNLHGNFS